MSPRRSSPPCSGRAALWLAVLGRGEALPHLVSSTLDTGPGQETQQPQVDTALVAFPYWGHMGELVMQTLAQRFLGKGLQCYGWCCHMKPFSESCSEAVNLPFGAQQEGGSSLEKPWHWLRRSCLHCRHILLSLLSLPLLASFPFLSRSFFSSPLLSALQ